jgi:hypothetical protein
LTATRAKACQPNPKNNTRTDALQQQNATALIEVATDGEAKTGQPLQSQTLPDRQQKLWFEVANVPIE